MPTNVPFRRQVTITGTVRVVTSDPDQAKKRVQQFLERRTAHELDPALILEGDELPTGVLNVTAVVEEGESDFSVEDVV